MPIFPRYRGIPNSAGCSLTFISGRLLLADVCPLVRWIRHPLRGLCLPIDQPIQPHHEIINPMSLRAIVIAIELDVRLVEPLPELGKPAGLKKREEDFVI